MWPPCAPRRRCLSTPPRCSVRCNTLTARTHLLLPSPRAPCAHPAARPCPTGWYAKKYYIKTLLVFCQVVSFFGCLLAAVANRRMLMLLALNMMAISGYSTQPVRHALGPAPAAVMAARPPAAAC